jgi:hypothetical protein
MLLVFQSITSSAVSSVRSTIVPEVETVPGVLATRHGSSWKQRQADYRISISILGDRDCAIGLQVIRIGPFNSIWRSVN